MNMTPHKQSTPSELWVTVGTATVCGDRSENQDRVYADAGVLAVFDGVAGRPLGGVAAATGLGHAIAAVAESRARGAVDVLGALRAAEEAVEQVNRRVGLNTATTGTLLALYSVNGIGYARVGWVGDTSAFVVRRDDILRLTLPHVQPEYGGEKVAAITRWLGDPSNSNPEITTVQLEEWDRVVVVSDGVSDALSDADIGTIVADANSPQEAVDQLVFAALEMGTRDNASAAVAFLTDEPRFSTTASGRLFHAAYEEIADSFAEDVPLEILSTPHDTDTQEERAK